MASRVTARRLFSRKGIFFGHRIRDNRKMCGICKDFNCASIICYRGFDREVGVFTTPKFADIIDSLEQLVVADKKHSVKNGLSANRINGYSTHPIENLLI